MLSKHILVMLGLLALTFFSCKKEEATVTYELTLKATKSSVGTTTFLEIQYNDLNGKLQTLLNQTQDFSTTFPIKKDYFIEFQVTGVITGASTAPTSAISYQVDEIKNGVRSTLCQEVISSFSGIGSTYTFNSKFSKNFDGKDCN